MSDENGAAADPISTWRGGVFHLIADLVATGRLPTEDSIAIDRLIEIINDIRAFRPPADLDQAQIRVQVRSLLDLARHEAAGDIEIDPVAERNNRPDLVLDAGELPWLLDRMDQIIAAVSVGLGVFERGGMLVRAAHPGRDRARFQPRRSGDSIVLRPVDAHSMRELAMRAIDFSKNGRRGKQVAADCPHSVVAAYLSRGSWAIPPLLGIVSAPTLRPDGSILNQQGYDPATGLLLSSPIAWPTIPEAPTRADVERAVHSLLEPFTEFPFDTPADRAVVASAILTGLVRRTLSSAPLHAFTAPTQASGKSLIADCIAIIVTGNPAPSMPAADSDGDELRKTLTSALLAGDPILLLDNVTRPLSSAVLAMILTQATFADRLLGTNQRPTIPTNAMFLVTGNNLILKGDMISRAIVCRIDPGVERPEERTFGTANLRSYVRDRRAELATAALTILRAHHVAGRPQCNLRPFGRFEQWSETVRAALVWSGLADPCTTRERIVINDSERLAASAVLAAWREKFGAAAVLLRNLIAVATDDDDLHAALLEIAAEPAHPDRIDVRRLGAWVRRYSDRVVDNLRLERGDAIQHHAATWRVVSSVEPPHRTPASANGSDSQNHHGGFRASSAEGATDVETF